MSTAVKENKKVENDTNESTMENKSSDSQTKLKRCFIITPIGSETSEIRRQIDGMIDACIKPVLTDFDVTVSHRICTPGSINNQVINHIYEDDLVIANLTSLNPNVMYELAFRHTLQKPVIVLKNKNDELPLPFDVKDDRVIFYTNDFMGSMELSSELKRFLNNINYEEKSDNPISRSINDLKVRESLFINESKSDDDKSLRKSLKYVISRFDKLENYIISQQANRNFTQDSNLPKTYEDFMQQLDKINNNHYIINVDDVYSHISLRHEFEWLEYWFMETALQFSAMQREDIRERLEEVRQIL